MKFLSLLLALSFMPIAAFSADRLQVDGNKIMYGEREVMLQGVAVGDPLMLREERPLSDYSVMAHDWNANVVRISIHPGTWRDHGRIKTMEVLRKNVAAALEAGMFVIITWHAIGIPDDYMEKAPKDYSVDLYDTDFALAQDFWLHIGKAFGKDGRIMFELWNEPTWPAPKDGKPVPPKWEELKPYWDDLTGVVRYNSKNLVIVTSNGWGYNLKGVRVSLLGDKNTAYAWHVYAGTDKNDPVSWEHNLDGLQYVKPVLVTEWGFEPDEENTPYHGNVDDYGRLFADHFIRDKQLHHTAWCWNPTWMPRMLENDWSTPTEYGAFIKEVQWRRVSEELVRP